jgi:hypothetical protein
MCVSERLCVSERSCLYMCVSERSCVYICVLVESILPLFLLFVHYILKLFPRCGIFCLFFNLPPLEFLNWNVQFISHTNKQGVL